jgi:hypothetical protein
VPAPGTGIEEGHHAERALHRLREPLPKVASRDHLGRPGIVRVEEEVEGLQHVPLEPVRRPPVHEEPPLVLQAQLFGMVVHRDRRGLFPPLALLNLPPGHVGVDQRVGRGEEAGPRPDDEGEALPRLLDPRPKGRLSPRVEEVGDREAVHPTEDRVVPEVGGAQPLDVRHVAVGLADVHHEDGAQPLRERLLDLVHPHARIALHGEDAPGPGPEALEPLDDGGPADVTFDPGSGRRHGMLVVVAASPH